MFIVQYTAVKDHKIFNNATFKDRESAEWYLLKFKSGISWPELKIVATFTVKLKNK